MRQSYRVRRRLANDTEQKRTLTYRQAQVDDVSVKTMNYTFTCNCYHIIVCLVYKLLKMCRLYMLQSRPGTCGCQLHTIIMCVAACGWLLPGWQTMTNSWQRRLVSELWPHAVIYNTAVKSCACGEKQTGAGKVLTESARFIIFVDVLDVPSAIYV